MTSAALDLYAWDSSLPVALPDRGVFTLEPSDAEQLEALAHLH